MSPCCSWGLPGSSRLFLVGGHSTGHCSHLWIELANENLCFLVLLPNLCKGSLFFLNCLNNLSIEMLTGYSPLQMTPLKTTTSIFLMQTAYYCLHNTTFIWLNVIFKTISNKLLTTFWCCICLPTHFCTYSVNQHDFNTWIYLLIL